RHERRDREAIDAVALDDSVDDDDERARGTADLDARAAERRDEESRDDGGPETGRGGEAAGDREGDRQRDRDDADDDAGREGADAEVAAGGEGGAGLRRGVAAERRGELGDEHDAPKSVPPARHGNPFGKNRNPSRWRERAVAGDATRLANSTAMRGHS